MTKASVFSTAPKAKGDNFAAKIDSRLQGLFYRLHFGAKFATCKEAEDQPFDASKSYLY